MASRTPSFLRSSTHCPLSLQHPPFSVVRQASTAATAQAAPQESSVPSIPPEHPSFIYVPKPPQQQYVPVKWHKGTLPIPRRVFKKTDKMDKTSREYLSDTIPEPFPRRKPLPANPAVRDRVEFQAAGSALRRQNLREGLRDLRHRQTRTDTRLAQARADFNAARDAAIAEPERPDEYLSRATVMSHMLSPALWRSTKQRNIAERRARYAERMAVEEEERRGALHTLYVNAGDFIVNNDQLETRIKEVFEQDVFYQTNPTAGIWDKEGLPDRASDLLRKKAATLGSAVSQGQNFTATTRERLERIGEELTGGKTEKREKTQDEMDDGA